MTNGLKSRRVLLLLLAGLLLTVTAAPAAVNLVTTDGLDLIEAIVKRVRQTDGSTLTFNVADGQFAKRVGTEFVGDTPAPAPHKDTHKIGGSDAFTLSDVVDAVVKRLQESGGTTLTMGPVLDGEYLKRVGSELRGAAGTGGGGSGTATALHEAGGTILPLGPINPNWFLVRDVDPTTQQPRVSGRPLGLAPYKVCHPGVLEHSDPNTWMTVNVTGVDACDVSVDRAVRVRYFVRYMASSPGIKFRFVEGASITTWGGWGSMAGSAGADATTTGGDNPLDWGAAGWGHPNTRTLWLYAARDGAGPFTLQFAPTGTGTARINTGTEVTKLRAEETGW